MEMPKSGRLVTILHTTGAAITIMKPCMDSAFPVTSRRRTQGSVMDIRFDMLEFRQETIL
jgi:hypothetical protein